MDQSLQLLDRFEKLGLSRNEAAVYLALLHHYPVTGYKLAKESGILRPIVYEMLTRLVEKGGVRMTKSTSYDEQSKKAPEYYSPIPPETFLASLEKRFIDAKSIISKELANITTSHESNDDDFWNIYERTSIIACIQEMILSAKENILFYINNEMYSTLLRDALSKKVASGIKVVGFSYRDIILPGTDIYTFNINHEIKDPHIADERILIVIDHKNSLCADMDVGKACQSTRAAQVDTIQEFIHMKIALYRLGHVMTPTKLALYLFDDDKSFIERFLK